MPTILIILNKSIRLLESPAINQWGLYPSKIHDAQLPTQRAEHIKEERGTNGILAKQFFKRVEPYLNVL